MTQDEDEDEDGSSFVAISKFRCAIYMAMKKKKIREGKLMLWGQTRHDNKIRRSAPKRRRIGFHPHFSIAIASATSRIFVGACFPQYR